MNLLILHGYGARPDSNFFQWLSQEFPQCNIPQLPNTNHPSEEQVEFVLKNIIITPDTIILGHSLGVVVALKVIEKLNHQIKGLISVGGFLEPTFKDRKRSFENSFRWSFDFDKVKKNAKHIVILSDRNDYAIPLEQGRALSEKLNATLIETIAEKPHFSGMKEPMVLAAVNFISSGNLLAEWQKHSSSSMCKMVLSRKAASTSSQK